ncbi:MAG: YncE family protein, partial [Candidatus Zixiibacteriota bacterium]
IYPHWLEYDPGGQFYYVVSRNFFGQVAKFDAQTNALIKTVTTNIFPTSLAITPDGMFGYLCDFNSASTTPGHIHKYNLNTMTFVDSSLGNGAASHDLMFNSNGSMLVACSRNTDDVTLAYFPGDSAVIIPLDTANPSPNPAVHWPYGVHIDHKDSLAYITCLKSGQVKIIDLNKKKVIDSILIPITSGGCSPAGPTLSVLSHDDSKIYVTTQCGNSLVVANTSTKQILADIPFSTPRPFGVKINHDGSRVYVACANALDGQTGRIYVIDGINLVKIDSIDVGLNSYGLFWHAH